MHDTQRTSPHPSDLASPLYRRILDWGRAMLEYVFVPVEASDLLDR